MAILLFTDATEMREFLYCILIGSYLFLLYENFDLPYMLAYKSTAPISLPL